MRWWTAGLAALLVWGGGAAAESLPVRGFLQGESAYRLLQPNRCPRTQRPACREEFVLGGERLQLELAPRGEWWGFLGKAEMIHDAVGTDTDVDLREGYLDFRFPALDLRLGRQIITWGVGDLIYITDVFPKDRVAFISGLPLEYLKKGSDAANVTVHWAENSLQLILIPRFEPDTVPEARGRLRFNDPMAAVERRSTEKPSPALENTEAGARFSRNLFGWDLSLYAYRGFFHQPAAESEPRGLRVFYPPLNVYGASGQGAVPGGVASLEGGYYDSRSDRAGLNTPVENSSVKLLAGYQRELVPDLTASGQYFAEIMEDHGEYLKARGAGMPKRPWVRHVLTLRLTQLLLHQTLRLGLFVLGSPNEGDLYANPEVKYNVTDALWATVGMNLFGGPRRTENGQFEGNSNLYAVIRYAF